MRFAFRFALIAPLLLGLPGCFSFFGVNSDDVPAAERQLPASTQALLAIKGMKQESPIFIRIFKEESELEVWKLKDGRFQLFRTYPICAWSGGLGPKVQQGDRQAPEGFYTVGRSQMNPRSLYHLAFNIGFPNAYDHANGHTGSALMIHGDCKSVGCYAMTDAYIEEIYILAREAFNAGQTKFHVHAFPFRMTDANMQRYRDAPWQPFWMKLKEGYDAFEASGKPPIVKVCSKQYLVNVQFPGQAAEPAPDGPCPIYAKVDPANMPGIDGVPPTLLASLSKSETSPPQPEVRPATVTAAAQPASNAPGQVAEMSASPVITKPAAGAQIAVAANMPPVKTLAGTPNGTPKVAASESRPASMRVAAASSAQPVSFQVGTAAPSTQTPPVSVQPVDDPASKAVDPNALQKPNRSGKGGKLSGPTPPTESAQILADGDAAKTLSVGSPAQR